MQTQILVLILASTAVCAFAQVPTPPRPAEDAKVTQGDAGNTELRASKALQNAQQVAILLNSFASDNGGKLPQKLEELVPAYVADKAMLPELELKTPGAELSKLAPDTVVLKHTRDAKIAIKAGQLQGIKTVAREGESAK